MELSVLGPRLTWSALAEENRQNDTARTLARRKLSLFDMSPPRRKLRRSRPFGKVHLERQAFRPPQGLEPVRAGPRRALLHSQHPRPVFPVIEHDRVRLLHVTEEHGFHLRGETA